MILVLKSIRYFLLAVVYDVSINIISKGKPSSRMTAFFGRQAEKLSKNLSKYEIDIIEKIEGQK